MSMLTLVGIWSSNVNVSGVEEGYPLPLIPHPVGELGAVVKQRKLHQIIKNRLKTLDPESGIKVLISSSRRRRSDV